MLIRSKNLRNFLCPKYRGKSDPLHDESGLINKLLFCFSLASFKFAHVLTLRDGYAKLLMAMIHVLRLLPVVLLHPT